MSTANYQVGITAIATGTLVPVDQANSNRFTAKSPATVDFIADVVGYFEPPGDATSLDIKVAGGAYNTAGGDLSFAAGRSAKTQTSESSPTVHHGMFVFADSAIASFHSSASNEYAARATGGVRFVTANDGTGAATWTCGVSGGAGGSWGCSSDRDLKTDLGPLDGVAPLERLAALPVYQRVARNDPRRIPHAGPTAQDFMAAFGLGDNDRMIGFADAQGIAFAATQGLNARLAEQDREIAKLKRAVEILLFRTSSDGRAAKAPKATPSPRMSMAKIRTKERT